MAPGEQIISFFIFGKSTKSTSTTKSSSHWFENDFFFVLKLLILLSFALPKSVLIEQKGSAVDNGGEMNICR